MPHIKTLIFLIVYFCLSIQISANEPKHILVLHSYHQSMGWIKKINQSIVDVLKPEENNYILHIENMDTKRIYTPEYIQNLKEIYHTKYQNTKFSLILSTDNNAFDFLRKYRDELFGNIPVSFSGVNFFKQSDLQGLSNFTGAAEVFDAKATIEDALKILPDTQEIYIINDYLKTGRAWEKEIKLQIASIDSPKIKSIKVTYAPNQSMPELQQSISKLSKDTFILLGVYFKDNTGKYFTYEKTGQLLTRNSSKPIFCLLEFNLHHGVVGGNVIGGYFQGEAMSKIALQLLSGTPADSIPVLQSGTTKLVYDYPSLITFGINMDNVDKNAIILNYPVSFWEKYKKVLLVSFVIILLLSFIIVILLIANKKRKIAENKHKQLSHDLEITVTQRTKDLTLLKERLELALIGNNDGVWDWNLETNDIYFSPRWKEMLGFSDNELTNKFSSWEDRVHPDDLSIVMKEVQNTLDGQTESFENTHRLKHKDGHWCHILARSKVVVRDSSNKPTRFTGTHTDISYLKEIENKLLAKTNEWENLVNNISSVIYQCKIDKDWTMFYLNSAIYDLTGYKFEDLLHNKFYSFANIIHPDDSQMVNEIIMQAIKQDITYKLDYRLIHKNGDIIWVHEHGKKLFDENQKAYLEGIITNITKEKEQYLQLQKFIDIQDSIVILTNGKQLQFANKKFFDFFNYENLEAFLKNYSCICDKFIVSDTFFHLGKVNHKSNWINYMLSLSGRQRIVSMLDNSSVPHAFNVSLNKYDQKNYVINFTDISDNMAEKLQLKNQATHDPLTNAYNRTYFNQSIVPYINPNKNNTNKTAIVFLDIDHFKQINDDYGHKVGDNILIDLVQLIHNHIRTNDRLIRWGGEEFIIVISSESLKDTYNIAEHLRTTIEYHSFYDVKKLTCSFGIWYDKFL